MSWAEPISLGRTSGRDVRSVDGACETLRSGDVLGWPPNRWFSGTQINDVFFVADFLGKTLFFLSNNKLCACGTSPSPQFEDAKYQKILGAAN